MKSIRGQKFLDEKRPTATLWLPVVIGHASLPIAVLCVPVVMDFGFERENLICKSANEVEELHRKKKTT